MKQISKVEQPLIRWKTDLVKEEESPVIFSGELFELFSRSKILNLNKSRNRMNHGYSGSCNLV